MYTKNTQKLSLFYCTRKQYTLLCVHIKFTHLYTLFSLRKQTRKSVSCLSERGRQGTQILNTTTHTEPPPPLPPSPPSPYPWEEGALLSRLARCVYISLIPANLSIYISPLYPSIYLSITPALCVSIRICRGGGREGAVRRAIYEPQNAGPPSPPPAKRNQCLDGWVGGGETRRNWRGRRGGGEIRGGEEVGREGENLSSGSKSLRPRGCSSEIQRVLSPRK